MIEDMRILAEDRAVAYREWWTRPGVKVWRALLVQVALMLATLAAYFTLTTAGIFTLGWAATVALYVLFVPAWFAAIAGTGKAMQDFTYERSGQRAADEAERDRHREYMESVRRALGSGRIN